MTTTLIAAALCAAITTLPAKATEYVMSASADYSGPFAGVMPNAMSGINAVADWWNKEVGAKIGATVKVKIYDMRYDPSVIARSWPSIISSD
jgi:branched-chain amino acid transport system substrate-binding protein